MKLRAIVFLGAMMPAYACAGEAALQACVDVYKSSTRNTTDIQQTSVELARSFYSFCKKDGSVNTDATSVGLDAVVKAIPFKFSADNKSSSEKLSEFCSSGKSQVDNWNSNSMALSNVANDALSNFNNCVQIANSGLQLSFSINQPETLVVSGVADAGYAGFLSSIAYDDKAMTCTSSDFDSRNRPQTVHGSVHLQIDKTFSITCTKQPQLAGDGSTKYYPRSTLTLTASALSPLSIVFPSDTLNGFELASQAGLAVAKAASDVTTAQDEATRQKQLADSLQSRLLGVTATITTHELGSGTAWGCGPYKADWGRGLIEEAQRVCGASKYVLGSNNNRSGGGCGYGSIGYACIIVPQ